MSDEVVACEECGLPLKHPAPGSGGTWRHGTCARGEGPPKDDPLILAMQRSAARRELEDARVELVERHGRIAGLVTALENVRRMASSGSQFSRHDILGIVDGALAPRPGKGEAVSPLHRQVGPGLFACGAKAADGARGTPRPNKVECGLCMRAVAAKQDKGKTSLRLLTEMRERLVRAIPVEVTRAKERGGRR